MCVNRRCLILLCQALKACNLFIQRFLVILHAYLRLNLRRIPQGCDPQQLVLVFCQLGQFVSRYIFQRNVAAGNCLRIAVRLLQCQHIVFYLLFHILFHLADALQGKISPVNPGIKHEMAVKIYSKAYIYKDQHAQNTSDHNQRFLFSSFLFLGFFRILFFCIRFVLICAGWF